MAIKTASACSSLDFSLRFFRPFSTSSEWHLLEHHTEVGANARTFSIGRVYDESGRELATMSQVSIMRPKEGEGITSEEGMKAKL